LERITYITTCKGRLEHLKQSLPAAVAAQAAVPGEVALVVVDFACPQGAGDWVNENFPQVRVIRVEDAERWQAARARNCGAHGVQSDWIAFFDADVVLAEDFFERALKLLEPGHLFLCDRPLRDAAGSCIVERAAFEAVGGYDEAMTAYAGEDTDLYDSLQRLAGLQLRQYPGEAIRMISHSDAERVRFLDDCNVDRSVRLGYLYRIFKFDFFRVTGTRLSLEERRLLLRSAEQMVDAAAKGKSLPLRFSLPARPIKTSPARPPEQQPRLRAWLRYELEDYGMEQGNDTRDRDA
jgi:hypothetical protein